MPGIKVWSQGREKYLVASMSQTLDSMRMRRRYCSGPAGCSIRTFILTALMAPVMSTAFHGKDLVERGGTRFVVLDLLLLGPDERRTRSLIIAEPITARRIATRTMQSTGSGCWRARESALSTVSRSICVCAVLQESTRAESAKRSPGRSRGARLSSSMKAVRALTRVSSKPRIAYRHITLYCQRVLVSQLHA